MAQGKQALRFAVFARTIWITKFGIGVGVMSAVLAGAALNTGTNLLYVMLSLLLALIALSLLVGWVNLKGLSASRIAPAEIHANRAVEIQFALRNTKRWMTSYGISVEESIQGADPRPMGAFFLAARPGMTSITSTTAVFNRRGLFRPEGVRLATLFPFGLIEFRLHQRDPLEWIVYPEILPMASPPRRWTRGMGDEERAEKGHGAGLHSIREYAPGDPARDIHWRLSAKGTGLKLREYESEADLGVLLVLDARRTERPTLEDLERFEQAISLTATLATQYERDGVEVALWTAAGSVPRGAGPAHLRRILRSLALVEMKDLSAEARPPSPRPELTQVWISGPRVQVDPAREGSRADDRPIFRARTEGQQGAAPVPATVSRRA